jgi:hypothetical protein
MPQLPKSSSSAGVGEGFLPIVSATNGGAGIPRVTTLTKWEVGASDYGWCMTTDSLFLIGRKNAICDLSHPATDFEVAILIRVNPKWTGHHEARHEPGEVKLDITFGPIARDRGGLN